ncbi:MAG: F0F1 ATP synthase subunit B [Candidatus Omnitrophica bacterium]|nr:F0F1 ATP synthase subunit B [Candidatus Omnitrophota bacterium]
MVLDPIQILVHAIGFLILLAILRKFAWGAILGVLEDRAQKISEEFRSIEETKKELAKLREEYQENLAKIEEESRAKIQASILEGRRIAMEIEEDARQHSRDTLEKAKEAVANEVAKATQELKEQVVDLAIGLTHKVLRQHLDEETDRRLIEGFIQEINGIEGR